MINQFEFICLDLWGTLFIESPEYKSKIFEIKHKAFVNQFACIKNDKLKKALEQEKQMFFEESANGFHTKITKRIERILTSIDINASKTECENICKQFEEMACDVLPDINNELLSYLRTITNKIILCSNSGFTSSRVVKCLLYKLGIDNLFYKMYFSDQLKITKSNPKFYLTVANNERMPLNKFLMVGDNLNNDVTMPNKVGLHGLTVHDFVD